MSEETETTNVPERTVDHVMTVIFDGNCDHDWDDGWVDPEGVTNYRCRFCPMGKRVGNG